MLKMKNGFFETDCDCMQCCKELGKQVYLFIQVLSVENPLNGNGESSEEEEEQDYLVVASRVDASDMSRDDIEAAIYGFYRNISDMEAAYGADISELMQLVAECRFENVWDRTGYDYVSGPMPWNLAEQTIQCFIDRNGSWEG